MKLVQLNIWQGRLSRSIVRFLEEQDADFLTLQEVYSSPDGAPRVGMDNFGILEKILTVMPQYHVSLAPLYSYSVADKKVTFTNVILSKIPVLDEAISFTQGKYIEDVGSHELENNTRNVQKVVFSMGDKKLTIVNMHSHWHNRPVDTLESIERMQKTADFIGEVNGPVIVAGDTNVNPDTKTAKILDKYGTNLTRKHEITSTMTHLAAYEEVAPDQIVVSEHIKVVDFSVSSKVASDHKALILEFEL